MLTVEAEQCSFARAVNCILGAACVQRGTQGTGVATHSSIPVEVAPSATIQLSAVDSFSRMGVRRLAAKARGWKSEGEGSLVKEVGISEQRTVRGRKISVPETTMIRR